MAGLARIGIVGDLDRNSRSHAATSAALHHSAEALSGAVVVSWLPTPSLEEPAGLRRLEGVDGLWGAPGSPYRSMAGALGAIRFARERNWPFFAT